MTEPNPNRGQWKPGDTVRIKPHMQHRENEVGVVAGFADQYRCHPVLVRFSDGYTGRYSAFVLEAVDAGKEAA